MFEANLSGGDLSICDVCFAIKSSQNLYQHDLHDKGGDADDHDDDNDCNVDRDYDDDGADDEDNVEDDIYDGA